jgi:hypothetical protein
MGWGENLECHVKNLKLLSLLVIVDLALFFFMCKILSRGENLLFKETSDSQGFLVAIFQKTFMLQFTLIIHL